MQKQTENSAQDFSSLDFIRWLAEKTAQAYLVWERRPNLISAALPERVLAQFVTSVTDEGNQAWRLFTIRDTNGEELYRMTSRSAACEPLTVALAIDKLFSAAMALSLVN